MTTDSPVLVSVVIVTWNGRRHLDACLTAVGATTDVPSETILVDNGSTDGTADYVRERFPWVRVIALPENRGFTGGNNAGAREARGRYLAFLNNDTIVEIGWLAALLRSLDEANGFALASARIVYMHDPTRIDSAGDGMLRWGGAYKRHHGASIDSALESREVFGVCGAACLLPKAIFDELGGFDESFFASHEDVDLSYRARLRGYRCRYVADAIVRHRGSATLGRASAFAVFHGQRNLEWTYLKNTPARLLLRTLAGHLLYDAAAAIYFARSGMLLTFMRAKLAALAGLPRVLRQRAAIQRARRVDARRIWLQLDAGWIGTKIREKTFDLELAERS